MHRLKRSRTSPCYKAYPKLGNRSIFYPGTSAGSTITFGIVEDTSSNPTSNISFKRNACPCVLLISMSPWVSRIWIEVWVGTYDRIRRPVSRYVPKIPPFQGGENVIRLTLDWVRTRSIFYPGSSVCSTITFGIVEDTSSNPTSNIYLKRSACACVLV